MNVRSIAGRYALLAGCVELGSCAATVPRADDESATAHERTAHTELRAAIQERKQFDPRAREMEPDCRVPGGECGTIVYNPTGNHLEDALADEDAAGRELAMARSLRDAEDRACQGLPIAARAVSPLDSPSRIISASALGTAAHPEGATLLVHEPPGTSAQDLEKRLGCHLAYTAARGHVVTDMPDCPLVPRGNASVRPQGTDFLVTLRGEDTGASAEIWRRARRLSR